jgi:hypothetical protein
MAETVNFDSLTSTTIDRYEAVGEIRGGVADALAGAINGALRLAWNARGAADLATIESELSRQMGTTAAGPYLKNLSRAIRALDR